jgi:hypothetical protein
MIGHGRPNPSRDRSLPVALKTAARVIQCAAIVLLVLSAARAASADDLRVRIAWGGGADRTWQGTISVTDGLLSEPRSLGVEADEPGSMWLDGDPRSGRTVLAIQQRSPRGYDGVDLLVSAAPAAKLLLQLSGADQRDRPATVEIPLADLSGGFVNKELDNRGNRLLVMRAPGDPLRVHFARESLVFAPGETFRFTLEPHALPLPKGGSARIRIQLLGIGGKELWSQEQDASADQADAIPLQVVLPNVEGVYDIAITAVNSPKWSQAVRQPFSWKRTIAERRVQLLVLDPQPPPSGRGDSEFTPVVEIDPANPRWYEKLNKLPQLQLTKPRLRLSKGPLGNDCLQSQRHPLGELAQLKPNADSPDVSWEAYWLPINQPGRPHIVEIEYPSDVPQTFGVSILEPNAAGGLAPLVVDSTMANAAETIGSVAAPRWQRHRVIFWPRTTTPLLLISNRRDRMPAVYGKIRVLAGGQRLPSALTDRAGANRRLLAAYLDRPLIPQNFSAGECLDAWSGRSLDDWSTFYEGGTRLVEYLNHAGCNGLMVGVLADGSTIYPSALLQPTPRYDTGPFFATAQDPIRKDVLEMLMRLFDREDLQLIPMVEFAAPLPELEALRRDGGPGADGIEWIGPEGTSLCASLPSQHGLAPYYNVLDPRVQKAMLDVLRELMSRYARHPSLTGVAVRLSADGYAQLPGPDWGLDDATIARFERDTKLQVPGYGPQRFAQRSAFLAQEPQRREWLDWRAAQLAKFYRRVYAELAAIRPGCRLYLAGAGMMGGPELDHDLRPTLSRHTTIASALLRVGIDARHFRDDQQRIVLLRPERIAPDNNLGSSAADLEISQMPDIDRYFQSAAAAGSLFFHPSREIHVDSFDRKSPFKSGYTNLMSEPSLSGPQNRRRFVHSVATLDSQVMLDGGPVLSIGQEAAIRDVAAAYRALPAIRFQTVGGSQPSDVAQPVTFRYGTHAGRTYLYAVNDAPFATTARVHLEASASCRIEDLSGTRNIEPLKPEAAAGLYWEVALEPYDLVAVQLSEPNVECSAPHVTWPDAVESALGLQIRRLGARAAVLRNPPALDVVANPGFEQPAAANGQIPGWTLVGRAKVSVQLDKNEKHGGRQSIKFVSNGPVAYLASQPLAVPSTGRLAVSVWLRIAHAARQPPLRLALEGKLQGGDYYRFGPVGLAPNAGQQVAALQTEWAQYVFEVYDLPLDGLTSLRARFDLMGPGEVWIDDVQVSSLTFSGPEVLELSKLITLADVKLQNGQIGDCLHVLEGYWPRFLEENVALPAGAVSAETVSAKQRAEEEKPPERSGWLNRMKDALPDSLRF